MKKEKIKRVMLFVMILSVMIVLGSCASSQDVKECVQGHTYGFWGGLWHGIISPFSFIGSLFSDNIIVWSPNNNGHWYTFGFLVGIGSFSGGITRKH